MSAETEIIPVLDMARKVPKLQKSATKNVEDLRDFFHGYVSIANFLQFMGIKIKATRKGKQVNSDSWGASEWSLEYRKLAALRYGSDGFMFKKSANTVSVYSIDFLHANFEEVKIILLKKKHSDMYE